MPISHNQQLHRSQPTSRLYSPLPPPVSHAQAVSRQPVYVPCGVDIYGQTMNKQQSHTPPPTGFDTLTSNSRVNVTTESTQSSFVGSSPSRSKQSQTVRSNPPPPGVSGVNARTGRTHQRGTQNQRNRSASRKRFMYAPTHALFQNIHLSFFCLLKFHSK